MYEENRYRLVYGKTHDTVHIKDDKEDKKIGKFPVDLLNEYELKQQLLLDKLNELGYDLICYEPEDKDFKGEWVIDTFDNIQTKLI